MPHVYHGVTNELGGTYRRSEYQYFWEGWSSLPVLGWAGGKYLLGGQSSASDVISRSGRDVEPPHGLLSRRDRKAGVPFRFQVTAVKEVRMRL